MHLHGPSLYGRLRWIIKPAWGFYFSRIERFHPERVPASGPVLFTSNHPNSSTDAFVIGTSVPRKVNFVRTVRLFALKLVAWLLARCGVIPINRLKDNPHAMRTVLEDNIPRHGVSAGDFARRLRGGIDQPVYEPTIASFSAIRFFD